MQCPFGKFRNAEFFLDDNWKGMPINLLTKIVDQGHKGIP